MQMTDAEVILHHELVEERARRSELAKLLRNFLSDANDALEINAPNTALRRIRTAMVICEQEILK